MRRAAPCALQSGYIYHYAFAMLIGVVGARHLVPVFHGGDAMSWPILSVTTFLPLLGALAILLAAGRQASGRTPRAGSRLSPPWSMFALSLLIWASFDGSTAAFQFVEQAAWLGAGITYHMGVDGISMLFVVLTAALMPFCILASWESIEKRVPEYMIAFLVWKR